eukprot:gb/GFBE01034409.1/.p2 GENE.gb/GFBE01034409.1/~~gb/GFBE01034409.1/.p2  ORF type:complete len:125 (-),score=9.86 gb/GFBE01034409.1/:34-408(-)
MVKGLLLQAVPNIGVIRTTSAGKQSRTVFPKTHQPFEKVKHPQEIHKNTAKLRGLSYVDLLVVDELGNVCFCTVKFLFGFSYAHERPQGEAANRIEAGKEPWNAGSIDDPAVEAHCSEGQLRRN